MQKIMFNDKYGLTQAVLEGHKTMTRRLFNMTLHTWTEDDELKKIDPDDVFVNEAGVAYFVFNGCGTKVPKENQPAYKIGEEVAIAQKYKEIADNPFFINEIAADERTPILMECEKGWNNKMFVKASYMPHRIRITNIKVERLRHITDEDCLKEGIRLYKQGVPQCKTEVVGNIDFIPPYGFDDCHIKMFRNFDTPREAFAALIDKVSGKGTWEKNPWVFVYTFEVLK